MSELPHVLIERVSISRLIEPAPNASQRQQIFQTALRAPDHARLRPWRFLVVEGDGRVELGELMARAMQTEDPTLSQQQLDKLRSNPLRAPLVIVLIARISEHPKVPAVEQRLSLACATQNMLLAAHALGFGAIWRTGPVTFSRAFAEGLGLVGHEEVLGFLYLGTPAAEVPLPDLPEIDQHFEAWPRQTSGS